MLSNVRFYPWSLCLIYIFLNNFGIFQIFISHMLRVHADCLALNLFACFFRCLVCVSVILGSVRDLRVSNKSRGVSLCMTDIPV